MPIRFAINGLGRVGRALLRIAHDRDGLELAAVNDVVPAAQLARLVARDTVHGPFPESVGTIPVFQQPDPAAIDWSREGVEVVVEATGRFLRRGAGGGPPGGGGGPGGPSAQFRPGRPAGAAVCPGG